MLTFLFSQIVEYEMEVFKEEKEMQVGQIFFFLIPHIQKPSTVLPVSRFWTKVSQSNLCVNKENNVFKDGIGV